MAEIFDLSLLSRLWTERDTADAAELPQSVPMPEEPADWQAPHSMTEYDRQVLQQRQLAEDREMRRMLCEQNRAEAERYRERELARARAMMDLADGDIDVELPADPEEAGTPEEPEEPKKPKRDRKAERRAKKAAKAEAKARKAAAAMSEMPEQEAEAEPQPGKKPQRTDAQQKGRFVSYSSASPNRTGRITVRSAVTFGLLGGLLIGCVLYGKVQTNEAYTRIAQLQAELDDLNARNQGLRSEMEARMTVKSIEEYAQNEVGLRPLDQSQIEYIQLQTEDEVTITEPEENLIVVINDKIKAFYELLRGQ